MKTFLISTAIIGAAIASTVSAGTTFLNGQPCTANYSQEMRLHGMSANVQKHVVHGKVHYEHKDGNYHGRKTHYHNGIRMHRGTHAQHMRKCIDARWLNNRDLQSIRVKYPSQAICYKPNQF